MTRFQAGDLLAASVRFFVVSVLVAVMASPTRHVEYVDPTSPCTQAPPNSETWLPPTCALHLETERDADR